MSCPLCKAVQLLKDFVESLKGDAPDVEKLKEFVRLVEVFSFQEKVYVSAGFVVFRDGSQE